MLNGNADLLLVSYTLLVCVPLACHQLALILLSLRLCLFQGVLTGFNRTVNTRLPFVSSGKKQSFIHLPGPHFLGTFDLRPGPVGLFLCSL